MLTLDNIDDAYYDYLYQRMVKMCDEQIEYTAIMTDDDRVKSDIAFRILRERGL